MPKYQVEDTITGKKYIFEGGSPPTDQDIQNHIGENKPSGKLSPVDKALRIIGEAGAGAYEATPFAKRIGMISKSMGGVDPAQVYAGLGKPQGTMEQLANITGQVAPQIAMASPFLKGASMLPAIGESSILSGAAGLGAYSGVKAGLEGQPILPAMAQGVGQGALFGVGGRLGATLMPKALPFSETLGTALGAGTVGALSAPEGEKVANAIFNAGLGAMNPSQKYDFAKMLSQRTNLSHFGQEMFQIKPETTATINRFGWDAVKEAGTKQEVVNTPNGQVVKNMPEIASEKLQKGVQNVRNLILKQGYKAVENQNKVILNKNELSPLFNNLTQDVLSIQNPDNPIVKTLQDELIRIKGLRPQSVKQLEGKFNTEEIDMLLEKSGFGKQISLNDLANMQRTIWDSVKSSSWRSLKDAPIQDTLAIKLGNKIGDFISQKNPNYKMIQNQWRNMKYIEGIASDLTPKILESNWKNFKNVEKNRVMGDINQVEKYLSNRGLGQYEVKPDLEKYHAYQEWSNPNIAANFRASRKMQIALQTLGAMAGGAIGAPLGLKGMVGGGAIGRQVGTMKAIDLMRPKSYEKVLAKRTPNSKEGKIADFHHIAHGADILGKLLGG